MYPFVIPRDCDILRRYSACVLEHVALFGSWDGEEIISKINELPKSIAIIGGGIIAIECASIFGSLGVQAHVLNAPRHFYLCLILPVQRALLLFMSSRPLHGVYFNRKIKVEHWGGGGSEPVTLSLITGQEIVVKKKTCLHKDD
jgi:pyruvate/2-oxoglutarate dehydrogenase complex dihydrolipoamide dehydrogenase (E3) component